MSLTSLTIPDPQYTAKLQASNVSGWISVGDYETALICARVLVEALELLAPEQGPDYDENKEYEADQAWAAQPKEYDP